MMLRVIAVIVFFSATMTKPSVVAFFQSADAFMSLPKPLTRGMLNHAKPVPLKFLQQKSVVWSTETVSRNIAASIIGTGDDKDSNSGDAVATPSYNSEAKAVEFFSNKFFYKGNEVIAELLAQDREEKFGNKTVMEVFNEIDSERDIESYFSIFNSGFDLLRSFWNGAKASIESRLNRKIIDLRGKFPAELQVINDRYVVLPSFPFPERTDMRKNDICVVLGPSGSGKTFFAVKDAAKFNATVDGKYSEGSYSVVVYLHAKEYLDRLAVDPIYSPLFDIRKALFGLENYVTQDQPLNMHVSVVIDEAGSDESRYFEDIDNLDVIYGSLHNKLARSVRLIVTGTGLTAENLNSQSDVKKYRMKPWSEADIAAVARYRFSQLPAYVLDFVHTRPILKSLTTNARAAWFLLYELTTYYKNCKTYMTEDEFHDRLLQPFSTPIESSVIPEVARLYLLGNRLQSLNSIERRRVAAMVFAQVEESRRETKPTLQHFRSYGATRNEIKCATSLINVNVEYREKILQYIEKDKRSVSLSPAITIVLFSLLGVEPNVLSSWRGHEVMTALHAFRKMVTCIFLEDRECSKRLQQVQLRMLVASIPEPRAETHLKIPRFGPLTVWLNGEKAPFADVVAPFFLFQCKYTEQKSTPQDTKNIVCLIFDELGKCGLLRDDSSKKGRIGWATLNGLIKTWQSEIVSNKTTRAVIQKNMHGQNDPFHQCIFYPEVEIRNEGVPKDMGIIYDKFKVQGEVSAELPCIVNFVVSTNAKEVVLRLKERKKRQSTDVNKPENWEVSITPNDVDIDGQLKLGIVEQKDWEPLITRIRGNVTLHFYFG